MSAPICGELTLRLGVCHRKARPVGDGEYVPCMNHSTMEQAEAARDYVTREVYAKRIQREENEAYRLQCRNEKLHKLVNDPLWEQNPQKVRASVKKRKERAEQSPKEKAPRKKMNKLRHRIGTAVVEDIDRFGGRVSLQRINHWLRAMGYPHEKNVVWKKCLEMVFTGDLRKHKNSFFPRKKFIHLIRSTPLPPPDPKDSERMKNLEKKEVARKKRKIVWSPAVPPMRRELEY
jgi:hypothetical protein